MWMIREYLVRKMRNERVQADSYAGSSRFICGEKKIILGYAPAPGEVPSMWDGGMRMPMEERRGARDEVSVIGHERKRRDGGEQNAGSDKAILVKIGS
jgi:hypothetical protein